MITKENIITKIESTFPDFEISEEMEGLPVVIFSFLTLDLINAIEINDKNRLKRFVSFVNEVSMSEDNVVISCLSEIPLGLYDYSIEKYMSFLKLLSPVAQRQFITTIDLWKTGNSLT